VPGPLADRPAGNAAKRRASLRQGREPRPVLKKNSSERFVVRASLMVAGFLAEGALIGQVSSQLVQLLSLRSWIFQYGVAGLGRPARLQRDGSVTFGQLRWAADGEGLPAEGDVELLVESGGSFQGGFSLDRSTRDLRPTVHRCALSTAIVTRLAVRPAGTDVRPAAIRSVGAGGWPRLRWRLSRRRRRKPERCTG
jgi:hypothetical protein